MTATRLNVLFWRFREALPAAPTWARWRRWLRTGSRGRRSVAAAPGAPRSPPGLACRGRCPPSPWRPAPGPGCRAPPGRSPSRSSGAPAGGGRGGRGGGQRWLQFSRINHWSVRQLINKSANRSVKDSLTNQWITRLPIRIQNQYLKFMYETKVLVKIILLMIFNLYKSYYWKNILITL